MFKVGQHVWVVEGAEFYDEFKDKLGTVVGTVTDDSHPYDVIFGYEQQGAFREDELAPADVRGIEGVVGVRGPLFVGDTYLPDILRDNAGKHVTVTIVVKEAK
jgi:hypothetical protein